MDGVTSEHLKDGISDAMCVVLARLFSLILSWGVVPSSFCTGVIIPILKNPGLDTNDPDYFRPVTLSSTFSKILEIIMLPHDSVCETHFGFRRSRGTPFACVLFNDVRRLMLKNVLIAFGIVPFFSSYIIRFLMSIGL